MPAVFVKTGDVYSLGNSTSEYLSALPAGNYVLKKSLFGFFLEQVNDFTFNHKLYGSTLRRSKRVLDTFQDREGSTGVIMVGEKGSGKTLLARRVCFDGAARGIPTIIINEAFFGDDFNTFIQAIEQETIILFDEFEKVYSDSKDHPEQQQLLTLLDGTFQTKKLFVFTSNDKFDLNEFMQNRPGRIYYMYDFKGLEEEFVVEYCQDNLNQKNLVERVVRVSTLFRAFNFDTLKAIVEEMNRYNETPEEVLESLNAKPELSARDTYELSFFTNGVEVPSADFYDNDYHGNPLKAFNCYINFKVKLDEPDEDGSTEGWKGVKFEQTDMIAFNKGEFVFQVREDETTYRLVAKKEKDDVFDWRAL